MNPVESVQRAIDGITLILFVDCVGKNNLTNKIVVDVDLLGPLAAGVVRGVNHDLFHKCPK